MSAKATNPAGIRTTTRKKKSQVYSFETDLKHFKNIVCLFIYFFSIGA